VQDDATGKLTFFPCGTWFDKTQGDHVIERLLQAADPKAAATSQKLSYKVTVSTSDVRFAGTDANVFMEVIGERYA
jgi:hypothetical protein